jgi:uncharacterized protein (DUF1499 family)
MSESQTDTGEGIAWWAKFTLLGGSVAVLLMFVGPIGFRTGLLGVSGAVLLAPGMAAALAAISFVFALIGVFLTLRHGLVAERLPVLIGGALSVAILLNMGAQFSAANAVPPIHDITTAPADPPRFDAIVAERVNAPNTLDYDAAALTEPTRTAYPFVQPLVTDLAPAEAFARATALVEELGWELVDASDAAGLIEATDTTLFYGFKDDVVIRLRPEGAGTRIDLRSVSRVGQSDLGANAARIKAFLDRF